MPQLLKHENGKRAARLLLSLVCLAVFSLALPGRAAEVAKEYQLKAAFLYNFTKFVEWPTNTFANSNSPIIIGVYGRSPFGAELEKAVKDRRINGREILVKTVANSTEALTTHLLFVPATEDSRHGELMEALEKSSVLTVGESDAFLRREGIITFSLENDRLRFDINMDSAERASLKVSAQLQKLAKSVHRKPDLK